MGMMTSDHELSVTPYTSAYIKKFNIVKDQNKSALYRVVEEIPQYREPLVFTQKDWKGGHGQYEIKQDDVYYEGQSIDTTQDGKVFPGPMITQVGTSSTHLGANPVCCVWFSAISKLMVATGAKVWWYDGQYFVEKEDFTAIGTITNMVEYNSVLYVALGMDDLYYTSTDGDTFTVTDLTDHHAVGFFNSPNAAGTSNVLWKWITPNQIASTTNGTAGGVQWTSPAYIGDTSNNITNIFLCNDSLLIGRTDGLFNYDSDGGVHPLMDDLKHNRSTNNFKYTVQWQSATYFSLNTGLGEITAYDAFQPMGPLNKIDDIGKAGVCVGLASDKDYLYVAMDEGTNTHIYKGREVKRQNGLRWEWCPWVFLSTNACSFIQVVQHSATDRRLWFGYGNYMGFVRIYDNPLAETTAQYSVTSKIIMSYDYGTNPYWDKMWQSVVTETQNCTSAITVTPKYFKDTDTTASSLTAAITANSVVKTNLTAELSSKRIKFELDLATVREPTGTDVLTADATTSTTTIVDAGLASTVTDYYKNWYVWNVTRNAGAVVTAYNGSTKTLTHGTIASQVATDTYYLTSPPPIVTFFEARGVEKPETTRTHEVTYELSTTQTAQTKTLRTFLRGARTNTSLIKFADLRYGQTTELGTDYQYVVMLPGYPREVEIIQEKNLPPVLGLECKFKEVSYS